MSNSSPGPGTTARGSSDAGLQSESPGGHKDSPAEAVGRRTLSTAYVMLGPEGRLAITLRDGRKLVLRDVIIGPKNYCGRYVTGGKPGGNYCGGYAEVAAAEPVGPPLSR
jgi:hypothetical protein